MPVEDDRAVALHPTLEHRALLFLVFAGHHRGERLLEAVGGDVGDEAQTPLVDADERCAVARELARDAEHRAVAAEHHREVALAAEFVDIERGVGIDPGALRSLRLERNGEPLADEDGGDALEHLAYAFGLKLADERGVSKAGGHSRDYTTATLSDAGENRSSRDHQPCWTSAPEHC